MVAHRERARPKRRRHADLRRPASLWRERELLAGKVVEAQVAILETQGCSHHKDEGGCTMCGYVDDARARPPTEEELMSQVDHAAKAAEGARWVKLYTSGSMLDPVEVSQSVLERVVEAFKGMDMLTIESRAEFVNDDVISILGDPSRLEVAIGMESACDAVLEGSIHKGMTMGDFERAAGVVRRAGASLRAYVLLKPPFLTEAEAIDDALEAVVGARSAGAIIVSLNPVNVQRGTLVDYLHHRREYEPPWLWSVVEVLRRASIDLPEGTRVLSAPTAGGKARGAHNCGECDGKVLQAIEFHRLSGDVTELDRVPDCGCRVRWEAQLDLEGFFQGPFAPWGYRRG
jgi:radical SAM enzyme (TIGR01210 family)